MTAKIEGQIILWGRSAGLTMTIAAAIQYPKCSHFSFDLDLILQVLIVEISLDPLVTDTLFFLFPESL